MRSVVPSSAWRESATALAFALSLAALSPGHALAQCAEEPARKVFEAGKQYYDTGYYDDALKSFRRAYDMCPKAGLLKNIGATEERLGNLAAAIEAYEQYVKAAPTADDRDATLLLIGNLKKRVVAPPPSASSSASAAPSAPPPPSASSAVAPPPPPPPTLPPPPPEAPNRVPAYVALGVAGAATIGAVITGLVAKSRYDHANSNCAPRCPDSEVSGVKSMALVSTILTGVAVVSVGVSGVLFFTAKPAQTTTGLVPYATVGAAPGGVSGSLRWSF